MFELAMTNVVFHVMEACSNGYTLVACWALQTLWPGG